MKHALISGQIYRNEDGSKDIEIFTKIDNDNRITEIFEDVDNALLEQIEPNFEFFESYFFIAFVESEFVTYSTQEGTDYVIEHDVTELKSFKDLPQAIKTTEQPSVAAAVESLEGILTEEELNILTEIAIKNKGLRITNTMELIKSNRNLLSINAELKAENFDLKASVILNVRENKRLRGELNDN